MLEIEFKCKITYIFLQNVKGAFRRVKTGKNHIFDALSMLVLQKNKILTPILHLFYLTKQKEKIKLNLGESFGCSKYIKISLC